MRCFRNHSEGNTAGRRQTRLLGSADTEVFLSAGKKQAACAWVVAAGTDVALSGGLTFLKEIYAAGQFVGGERSTYRALLGEKDICLGPASHITRWAHAAGTFRAAQDCDLYGRHFGRTERYSCNPAAPSNA